MRINLLDQEESDRPADQDLNDRFWMSSIGERGENLVAQHLCSNGWQILAQRWTCRWSDLDIVASDRSNLIFVEVKTRSSGNWDCDGLLSITSQKQEKIWKAARAFLGEHYPQYDHFDCRFDVALVAHRAGLLILTSYLENAFSL
jgi:putative endonuclease